MSDRWIVILIFGICVIMFAPLFLMESQKGQCRIEAIKAGIEADKINAACGVK